MPCFEGGTGVRKRKLRGVGSQASGLSLGMDGNPVNEPRWARDFSWGPSTALGAGPADSQPRFARLHARTARTAAQLANPANFRDNNGLSQPRRIQ